MVRQRITLGAQENHLMGTKRKNNSLKKKKIFNFKQKRSCVKKSVNPYKYILWFVIDSKLNSSVIKYQYGRCINPWYPCKES